ncbi:MAG: Rpn family recombination-promoting nuclease/putative transposase [Bacteroidota bacterium]
MAGQAFDKIIKENLTASFLNLLKDLLGLELSETIPLEGLKHTSLRREVDFLAKAKTIQGEEFILHIEFQTHDEKAMVYRMAEYAGVLLRKYQIPIKQFVVYLGAEVSNMKVRLPGKQVISGFELISLNQFSYKHFISSNAPEVIVLGILSDFEGRSGKEVSREIIQRLKDLSMDKVRLEKHIGQLEILSNLRNLNETIYQTIKEMPFTIDISKSRFYQEGIKEGEIEGKKQGIKEGVASMVKAMLKEGLDINLIAKIADVSQEYIHQIKEEISSEEEKR